MQQRVAGGKDSSVAKPMTSHITLWTQHDVCLELLTSKIQSDLGHAYGSLTIRQMGGTRGSAESLPCESLQEGGRRRLQCDMRESVTGAQASSVRAAHGSDRCARAGADETGSSGRCLRTAAALDANTNVRNHLLIMELKEFCSRARDVPACTQAPGHLSCATCLMVGQ